jgi:hypothetical protein
MRFGFALFALGLIGCGPVVSVDGDDTGGPSTDGANSGPMTGPGTSSSTVPSTTVASTTSTTTTPTTTDPDSSGEDVGTFTTDHPCDFICVGDFDPPPFECSIWEQDCPEGEKCMPWANDGGHSWNATRCSPLADDPGAPGEACTVEGSGVSGIDSCDGTSMCWFVDPDTLEGTCVPFCIGDESNPSCPDACDTCTISGEGVLTICLPTCDPIGQDCGDGQGCYAWSESFVCAPDASGAGGAPGEPCEGINACDPGTMCTTGDAVPDCEDAGCCSPYCVVGDDTPCAAVPGTTCVAIFEDGGAPGCVPANVGVCALLP